LLRAAAILVLAFVLNKYFHAKAHKITLPNFHGNESLSNGHQTVPHNIQPHIVPLSNTDNNSLAASAESFLEIASSKAFAI
jgi:hypothetical protein